MVVELPAVALPTKEIVPRMKATLAVTKFCVIPELLVMPAPPMVNVKAGFAVMVNALAPALKTMPSTMVSSEMETAVVVEISNVAVSAASLGTASGVQLVAAFQSPEPGLRFHCASPAEVELRPKRKNAS